MKTKENFRTVGPFTYSRIVLNALTITLGVPQDLEYFGVGRVLTQCSHHISTLTVQDLAIPCPVKQLEGLLEL